MYSALRTQAASALPGHHGHVSVLTFLGIFPSVSFALLSAVHSLNHFPVCSWLVSFLFYLYFGPQVSSSMTPVISSIPVAPRAVPHLDCPGSQPANLLSYVVKVPQKFQSQNVKKKSSFLSNLLILLDCLSC